MDVKGSVEERNVGWDQAFKRGDAAGMAAFYAEDAVLMPNDKPVVHGKEGVQEFFQEMIDRDGGISTSRMVEFGVKGDIAYQVANITVTDTKAPDHRKSLEIFHRQPDGSWKIHQCIWNSDNSS